MNVSDVYQQQYGTANANQEKEPRTGRAAGIVVCKIVRECAVCRLVRFGESCVNLDPHPEQMKDLGSL